MDMDGQSDAEDPDRVQFPARALGLFLVNSHTGIDVHQSGLARLSLLLPRFWRSSAEKREEILCSTMEYG